MTYTELLEFLNRVGARPRKRLSQNFLIDQNIVEKIVNTADVNPGDVVLEIGPGPGAITQKLLEKGATVHAIEKDPIFAKELMRFQSSCSRLNVYQADALEFPIESLNFSKVIANLPFHITTPLLETCFSSSFSSITVVIQKEVADRIFAKEGTKLFGSLSLFARYYSELKSQFTVPSSCFFPKPSVDSSVIHLMKRETPDVPEDQFFPVMRRAFIQRRKMLSSSLKEYATPETIRKALSALSIREDARAEMLSFENWIQFVKLLIDSEK